MFNNFSLDTTARLTNIFGTKGDTEADHQSNYRPGTSMIPNEFRPVFENSSIYIVLIEHEYVSAINMI